MAYQQAHTGIRKLFVGRRWSTGYIGATSCTVKRATRADLRLTPLSLQPHPLPRYAISLDLPFSLPLSFLLSPAPQSVAPRSPSVLFPLRSAPSSTLFSLSLSLPPLPRTRLARSLARALSALLSRPSLHADAATPARLTQPNPRANFIPRRLTTTDGRRRPRRRRRRHRTRVTRHAVSTSLPCVRAFSVRFFRGSSDDYPPTLYI